MANIPFGEEDVRTITAFTLRVLDQQPKRNTYAMCPSMCMTGNNMAAQLSGIPNLTFFSNLDSILGSRSSPRVCRVHIVMECGICGYPPSLCGNSTFRSRDV